MLKQLARLMMVPVLSASCAAGAIAAPETEQFSGNASWYGIPFHGKKTASGEIFDMNKVSAANKELPLVTKVMVVEREKLCEALHLYAFILSKLNKEVEAERIEHEEAAYNS